MTTLAELRGLARSLAIYRGTLFRRPARRSFYRDFVQPGDLCFDVGAHVGNHLSAWLAIGARVVAVEPQPQFTGLLRRLYRDEPRVALIEAALGAEAGEATLYVSDRTPTVTTLSTDWIVSVAEAPGFQKVTWDRTITVPVTTLDSLISQHGVPAFCKIDVEGLESAVLRGLSRPLAALSFEYVPAARGIAHACLDRLAELGAYRFNVSIGESMRFVFPDWQDLSKLRVWLDGLDASDRSGDVYCRLTAPPCTSGL